VNTPELDKNALRVELRRRRRGMSAEQRRREEDACGLALARWFAERDGLPVAAYAAHGDELDLGAFIRTRWADGQAVWLPRVVGESLAWHPVRDPAQLQAGFRGIAEPDPTSCAAAVLPEQTVILLPGLGFDAAGGRIGQGAGYYDRELAAAQDRRLSIGVGFSCQELERVPIEAHDRRVDAVLLAGGWLRSPPVT